MKRILVMATFLTMTAAAAALADPALDAALDRVAPELKKWACVCTVAPGPGPDKVPAFTWHDYRQTAGRTDFWPASTIKLYAVVAALELLNEHEHGHGLDSVVSFEHRTGAGAWQLDCARTMREMISEVFRRSSNEDYTLLLRMTGVDRINTQFLTPARGFPSSALMRGYVKERPWVYVREEAQRIRLSAADGSHGVVVEHTWSGRFYAEERGCTVIDAKTGNVTSPRELAECLRRIFFHEHLPEAERYRLTAEQVEFLRHGGGGFTGLETQAVESGPSSWVPAVQAAFPKARYFHKSGVISNVFTQLFAELKEYSSYIGIAGCAFLVSMGVYFLFFKKRFCANCANRTKCS